MNRRAVLQFGLSAAAVLAAPGAFAQGAFPSRPIKLVVPFSAGGVNDIVGRQWAERVKPLLGSVFIENMGGAGGTLGVMEVQRADPDGHTILLGSTSTMVLNTMNAVKVAYDPLKDFVPIAIFCVSTTSIAVHPSVPAKTPAPVVERLTDASRKALAQPEFEKVLIDSGFETVAYYGDGALRYMAEEHARWKPVVDAIGLKTL
jgi:tripartite-type tricarboxylate transporter receptor subunit TctC